MGDFSIGTNFTRQRECGAGSNYRMDGSVYINKYNMNAYSFVDAFRQKNEKTRHKNKQLEEEKKNSLNSKQGKKKVGTFLYRSWPRLFQN